MLPTARLLARRPFSVLARVRSLAHNLESHHIQGYPVSHQGAKPDWGKQFKHIGDASMVFLPAMGLFLGWPLIVEKIVDGHL